MSSRAVLRILHIVPGLPAHGTEQQLARLIKRSDPARFHHHVSSLTSVGELGEELQHEGFEVEALGLPAPVSIASALLRLRRSVCRASPDIVHGWLYDANLASVAAVLGKRPGRPRLLWSIRHSLDAVDSESFRRRVTIRLGAACSRFADRIVYNSRASAAQHVAYGYHRERSLVVPNGIDCEVFRPGSAGDRAALRHELGVDNGTLLVGVTARYHPLKDFGNLLRTIEIVTDERPGPVVFALAGRRVDEQNRDLAGAIGERGIGKAVRLLGERRDVPRLLGACDIACLSSRSEAFPNALAEAMACGVPCVATDVGDCRTLIGDAGVVVPPRDPERLAEGILKLLKAPKRERLALGDQARARVVSLYSLDAMVNRFESLYEEVVG